MNLKLTLEYFEMKLVNDFINLITWLFLKMYYGLYIFTSLGQTYKSKTEKFTRSTFLSGVPTVSGIILSNFISKYITSSQVLSWKFQT